MEAALSGKQRLRWEREIVTKAKAGDRAAFGELYREYAPMLFRRVLMPKLGARSAAEDALAETFKTVIERIERFEPKGVSVYFWMSRIAANKAMDMHRVKGRTSRALTNFEGLMKPLVDLDPEKVTEAERSEELRRLRLQIDAALSNLNPRYRRAIELRLIHDKARQECADEMEVKLGTFDVVLLRAVRAFRKQWETQIEAGAPEE